MRIMFSKFSASSSVPSDLIPIGHAYAKENFKSMVQFPKNQENRCFQPNWAERFEWLEYSAERDAVFCYACRQFGHQSRLKVDSTFVVNGFSKWKVALQNDRGFPKHQKSTAHVSAMLEWKEKEMRMKTSNEVSSIVCQSVLEKRQYYISSVIDVVKFLVKNELAFRGNWDKLNDVEDGLFMNLFLYTIEHDDKLKSCHSIMPNHAKYTSPDIQNELINILADSVRQDIVNDVNKSTYFTFFLDGTKDKERREILSIGVRYLKGGEVIESLLGFEECKALDAKSQASTAINALKSYGIKYLNRMISVV